MSIGSPNANSQSTLHKYWQRYQPPLDFDADAVALRSRARQEAEWRLYAKTSKLSPPACDHDRRKHPESHGQESPGPLVNSNMNSGSDSHVSMSLHDGTLGQDNTVRTKTPVSTYSAGKLDIANLPDHADLKRKRSPSHASTDDKTPRPARRPRSISAESKPASSVPSSSTNLSAPPTTSQLSIPTSLKSVTLGLSQDKPVYVPSSQSDENFDIEEGMTGSTDVGVRENESVVLNEIDSDSSLSSLESLSDILERHRLKTLPSRVSPAPLPSNRKSQYRGLYSTSNQRPNGNAKYSLENLVKLHHRDVIAREEMSKAQLELETRQEEPAVPANVDKAFLASVVKQDDGDDDVDKLLQAMDRADVMNTEIAWHFFHDGIAVDILPKTPKFPQCSGDLSIYKNVFKDRDPRASAFLTGFAGEILSLSHLSDELTQWLWQAALLEPREDLAEAYIAVLKSAKLVKFFHPGHITWLLGNLEAKPSSINIVDEIKPMQKHMNAPRRRQPQRLSRLLCMLANLPYCLSTAAKAYSIELLLRLSIDTEVTDDIVIRLGLQQSFTALVESLPQDTADTVLFVASANLLHLDHPLLQHRLLVSLPNASPRLCLFKRRLALSFFLSSPKPLHSNLSDAFAATELPKSIIARFNSNLALQTSDSNINYRDLAALISILDIGIGSGFQQIEASPSEASAAFSADGSGSESDTREAKARVHNGDVDAMKERVHAIFASIVDSGASHMARTEAKAVSERLIYRLDCAVRTKPREKKGFLTLDGFFQKKERDDRGEEHGGEGRVQSDDD